MESDLLFSICLKLFFYARVVFMDTGLLFLIHLLFNIMDIAYCMAMVFISFNVSFIVFLGISSFSSKHFIKEMCVVALTPTIMTINRSTF